MSPAVYLPSDEFGGIEPPDLDLAADYLELKAVFSRDGQSFSEDIVDALELAAEAEFGDVDAEIRVREDIAAGAVARMTSRKRVLATAYPFDLDDHGDTIFFTAEHPDLGQAAYLVSLLLSNLRALSPLLDGSEMHPSDHEVRELRQHFQYFATAAIAAEVGGPAWSFGHPRPDGTGFIRKLSEIWAVLKDGSVKADPAAPAAPKDDQVDVFAWREQRGRSAWISLGRGAGGDRQELEGQVDQVPHCPRVFCPLVRACSRNRDGGLPRCSVRSSG